jgi:hypothetical protein
LLLHRLFQRRCHRCLLSLTVLEKALWQEQARCVAMALWLGAEALLAVAVAPAPMQAAEVVSTN